MLLPLIQKPGVGWLAAAAETGTHSLTTIAMPITNTQAVVTYGSQGPSPEPEAGEVRSPIQPLVPVSSRTFMGNTVHRLPALAIQVGIQNGRLGTMDKYIARMAGWRSLAIRRLCQ